MLKPDPPGARSHTLRHPRRRLANHNLSSFSHTLAKPWGWRRSQVVRGGAGPRLSSLELRWPRPPPPTLPQAGSPHRRQTLGPRRDRAAGSLEHPRASEMPPGRAEEPAPLTSGSGAARPRPRRPGSRRAAGGLRRSARTGPTSLRALPPVAVT